MNVIDTLRGMATAIESLLAWQFLIVVVPCLLVIGFVLVTEEVRRRLPPRQPQPRPSERPYDWHSDGI